MLRDDDRRDDTALQLVAQSIDGEQLERTHTAVAGVVDDTQQLEAVLGQPLSQLLHRRSGLLVLGHIQQQHLQQVGVAHLLSETGSFRRSTYGGEHEHATCNHTLRGNQPKPTAASSDEHRRARRHRMTAHTEGPSNGQVSVERSGKCRERVSCCATAMREADGLTLWRSCGTVLQQPWRAETR